jgi:hypothetical protein
MIGTVADFIRRMLGVLPLNWFSDPTAPPLPPTLLQAVLAGFGTAWAAIYALISDVILLARLATVYGPFLDMAAADFFGGTLPRRPNEADAAFRIRVLQELLRPRATRSALILALTELTGQSPTVFEPLRPADTGGYNVGGVGYNVAGAWGNLGLRHTSFITAKRPLGTGIALFAGYDTGGYLFYGDLSMVASPVTDADIYASVVSLLPAGHTAWVRIEG